VDQREDDTVIFSHEHLQTRYCHACGETHVTGFCVLKRTGVEHCGLCGIAHFGGTDNCPNLKSEKQVRLMLDALKTSTEARGDIELARTQLRVRIHDLVQEKKQKRASLGPAAGNIQSSLSSV
jgi:chromodomain-helicase-DNA-binding protein 4